MDIKLTQAQIRVNVGKSIRAARIAKNISITELAEMLHLSYTFIVLIEQGRRGTKIENMVQIADILNLDLYDMVYGNRNQAMLLKKSESKISLQKQKIQTLNSLLYDASEAECDFMIETLRSLKNLRKSDNESLKSPMVDAS